jgi:hypothetical protein
MREYQLQRYLKMTSVSMLTMDIRKIWAIKLTRDYIKELD